MHDPGLWSTGARIGNNTAARRQGDSGIEDIEVERSPCAQISARQPPKVIPYQRLRGPRGRGPTSSITMEENNIIVIAKLDCHGAAGRSLGYHVRAAESSFISKIFFSRTHCIRYCWSINESLLATSDFSAICYFQTCDNGPPAETKRHGSAALEEGSFASTGEFECVPARDNAVMSDNSERGGGEVRPRCG